MWWSSWSVLKYNFKHNFKQVCVHNELYLQHIYVHMHIYMYIHKHACMQAHIRTHLHVLAHTCTITHVRTCTRMYSCIRTYALVHTHIQSHAHMCSQPHACTCTYTRTHARTHSGSIATTSGDAHLAEPRYLCTKQVLGPMRAFFSPAEAWPGTCISTS